MKLFRRGKGGTFYVRWYVSERTRVKSLHTANEREAKQRLQRFIERNGLRDSDAKRILVSDMIDKNVLYYSENAAQFEPPVEITRLRWMKPHLPTYVEQITHAHLELIVKKLKTAGKADRTINHYLHALRASINRIPLWWPEAQVPNLHFKLAQVRRPQPHRTSKPYTDEEVHRLIVKADGELRPAIEFLLLTGCRASEVCNLKWSDIDGQTIHIRRTKTGRDREYDYAGRLREVVESVPRLIDHVFTTSLSRCFGDKGSARRFTRRSLLARFRKLADEVGVSGTLHDFRHTVVSRLAQGGVPLSVYMAYVGHTSLRASEEYTHIGAASRRSAVGVLEKAIPEQEPKINSDHVPEERLTEK